MKKYLNKELYKLEELMDEYIRYYLLKYDIELTDSNIEILRDAIIENPNSTPERTLIFATNLINNK